MNIFKKWKAKKQRKKEELNQLFYGVNARIDQLDENIKCLTTLLNEEKKPVKNIEVKYFNARPITAKLNVPEIVEKRELMTYEEIERELYNMMYEQIKENIKIHRYFNLENLTTEYTAQCYINNIND